MTPLYQIQKSQGVSNRLSSLALFAFVDRENMKSSLAGDELVAQLAHTPPCTTISEWTTHSRICCAAGLFFLFFSSQSTGDSELLVEDALRDSSSFSTGRDCWCRESKRSWKSCVRRRRADIQQENRFSDAKQVVFFLSTYHIKCLTLILNIKYRLTTKLNIQIKTNLQDESIKYNQSMI